MSAICKSAGLSIYSPDDVVVVEIYTRQHNREGTQKRRSDYSGKAGSLVVRPCGCTSSITAATHFFGGAEGKTIFDKRAELRETEMGAVYLVLCIK